jgi:glutaconate CoA-transferase subunit B
MTEHAGYTASELLAVMSARLLKDGQTVFAGVGVPLLAATLAQSLHAPTLTILFEGGVVGPFVVPGQLPPSTNEQRCTRRANMVLPITDVLLLLQRGYVDVGFMGGAQIDRFGNLNSSYIGDPGSPSIRLPGTGAQRHLLAHADDRGDEARKAPLRREGGLHHQPRFIDGGDACAARPHFRRYVASGHRPALMGFDENSREMCVLALHPGVTPEQVQDSTGFDLHIDQRTERTAPPHEDELAVLRDLDPDRLYTA